MDGPEVHRHGLIFLLAGVCVCMLCPPRQHLFSYYPFFTLLMVLCQLFIVQSLRCFLFSLLRFLSKFFFFQPLFSQFFFEILLLFSCCCCCYYKKSTLAFSMTLMTKQQENGNKMMQTECCYVLPGNIPINIRN